MVRAKVLKLVLDDHGSYLGMEKGCYVLKDKHGNIEKYPQFETEVGEVVLTSGNMVSTGALANFGFWGIDVLIATRKGEPIAMLKSLDDDSHVATRIAQYEALKNGKALCIAKQFVLGKIEGQNILLNKYGLKADFSACQVVNSLKETDLVMLRRKLMHIEGKHSEYYFNQIFQLFPEKLRPTNRKTFHAYDGINNTFNLAYRLLFWKCYRALIKAHLETHLGFLHSLHQEKPSLVCDFQELYRYLIDEFLIQYCQKLKPKDFIAKSETWNNKTSKRIYLNNAETRDLMLKLNDYFRCMVKIPRIMRGEKQEFETLINEEALLFAQYLRNEKQTWKPRIAELPFLAPQRVGEYVGS